jgi:hypothetical protein
MSESVSPCIAEGLERIQTGWRVGYLHDARAFYVHKPETLECPLMGSRAEAKAAYLRLTEKREKGKS